MGGCSWGKLSQTSHIEGQGQGTAWKSGLCGKFFIPAGERGPPPCLPTPVRLCPLRGSTALTCLRGLGTGPALQKVAKTHSHCVCPPRHSLLLSQLPQSLLSASLFTLGDHTSPDTGGKPPT